MKSAANKYCIFTIRHRLLFWVLPALSPLPCSAQALAAAGSGGSSKTIGFVMSTHDYLFYVTKDGKQECPSGLTPTSRDNWRAQFPTIAARQAHYDRCGAVDNRGPNCEHVTTAPELIEDPLPFREVKGEISYGANLDGAANGKETATTCAHEQFTHPDGTEGIDNQHYRLLGCHAIAHQALVTPDSLQRIVGNSRKYRILLELRGVDDEKNDGQVEVILYQGRDELVTDANNKPIAWQTQRIDDSIPAKTLRGRIVDGELITGPADVMWENVTVNSYGPPVLIRGTQLRLRLSATGAEGLRTGYIDVESWWNARRYDKFIATWMQDSPPSLHRTLHKLADGYKDRKTGACTGLSSAMGLKFVRAHIRHPAGAGRPAVMAGTTRSDK